jgi:hypothetical protein
MAASPFANSRTSSRRVLAATLPLVLAIAACSTVPTREWPLHEQRTVVADYAASNAPIELPTSREDLTVIALTIEPDGSTESFEGGRRVVRPAPGASRVRVTCTYRIYAQGGVIPRPEDLFVGANVRVVQP